LLLHYFLQNAFAKRKFCEDLSQFASTQGTVNQYRESLHLEIRVLFHPNRLIQKFFFYPPTAKSPTWHKLCNREHIAPQKARATL